MHRSIAACLLLFTMAVGCGGSSSEARSADDADSKSVSDSEAKAAATEAAMKNGSIPQKCAKGKKHRNECVPPPGWVKRLCEDVYPEVALHMFQPGTPWKRMYMLANAEPFNASGGASLLGEKLRRGEEVIALRRRDGNTGVQVGDTAGYDVLRLNGSCATIHDGDYTKEKPSNVRYSSIEWRRLSLSFRNLLEAQPAVSAAYDARRKSCKGQNLGIVADTCERDDRALIDEVVRYIMTGARLPLPAKMP